MSGACHVVLCLGAGQKAEELLPDTAVLGVPWLETLPCTPDARWAIADYDCIEEVWVASGDGIEAVNLGAALKRDDPHRAVYLIGCEETGSMRSRAHAASLDGVLSSREAALRFRTMEERAARRDAGENAGTPIGSNASGAAVAGEAGIAPISEASVPSAAEREDLPAELPDSGGACASSLRTGFLFTVVSGGGGAGKSTVAVLAALLAARRGLRTALLDADLQFGDVHDLVDACTCVSFEEVADDQQILDDLPAEGLVLVRAPRRLEMAEAVGARLDDVVDALLARFEFVAVNTGGVWDEQKMRLLERSVTALFLVDQRLSSLRACRHALDLCLRCGVATSSFLLAVNRCSRHAAFTSIDVSSALHGAHVMELADGGSEVEELLGAGMAGALVEARNGLCTSVERLLDEIMPLSDSSGLRGQSRTVGRLGLREAPERERSRRRGRSSKQGRRRRREAVLAASDGNVG